MKYVVILPDGAADERVPELDGRTPLQVAKIPNMDEVSRNGQIGRILTVPTGFIPATDVATLSLFGYDPATYYTGRAPLEAAAQGLKVGPDDIIFRCNFVSIKDGRMADFTAGHIAQAETDRLIADLNGLFAGDGLAFHSGVSYRNLMLAAGVAGPDLQCAPPHDIPNQPVAEHRPKGEGAERVQAIMERAAEMIADHDVNKARRSEGRDPVSGIWLWGQGRPTRLPTLRDRYQCSCAVITGVDIIRGIAVCMGADVINVPGATGYIDTDYAGKGVAGVAALEDYDMVVVHIEAPDEAGHLGNPEEKILALERVDEHIVGPLLEAVRGYGDWRILVAPDHPTPVTTKAHSAVPPPWALAGTGIEASEPPRVFNEREAEASGVMVEPGHTLIDRFMR